MQQYSSFFKSFFNDLVVSAALIHKDGKIILAQDLSWVGSDWKLCIPNGIHDSFEHAFNWCIKVKKPRSVQAPVVEGNRLKWLQYRLAYFEENGFEGTSLIATDITDQVDTLNELEKLSRSIEQTPSMIVMTNLNGRIEYVNPSFEQLYETTLSQSFGKLPPQFDLDSETDDSEIWRALSLGESWTGDIKVKRPKGQEGYERLKAFCIQNELGEITQFCLISEDITNERQLQSQLIQSQRLEAIGTLAGGVAHDFNNILMIISGFSEIGMGKLEKDHKAYQAFKTILEATYRASKMTNSLLSFSRKQDLNTEVFNLSEFVENLVPLWERLISPNIQIHSTRTHSEILIEADKVHLEQILMNLVVNARDAIEEAGRSEGKITIDLSIYSQRNQTEGMEDQQLVMIQLKDNGVGISEEAKEKIFEPYYTTKEKGKGTGLGLSTVIGLVEQHKGHLEIESTPGEGTLFVIKLPLALENEELVERLTPKRKIRQEKGSALVVDDESSIRLFFSKVLKEMGYQVVQASDGQDGLKKLQNQNFDVIFTDLNMPVMDGLEFLEKIQGFAGRIFVITGYRQQFEEIPQRIVDSFGSIEFLKKPISVQALIKALKNSSS